MHNKKKHRWAFVLDNGAYSAKIGSSAPAEHPSEVPNCIMKVKSERRRMFTGNQINECRDLSGLFYILPFQKGYLVNWDIQKTVWDYIFNKELDQRYKLSETPLLVTEPVFNFRSNQEAMDEIFFEEYNCVGMLRVTGADCAAYNYIVEKNHYLCTNCIVIDTGYSFTHIIPYINGKKYKPGIKRMDIGGKLLTNYLKEILSYRQLNVMDETHVINQVKEDTCFVSKNFRRDMNTSLYRDKRNSVVLEYVLPDYNTIKRGYPRNIDFDNGGTIEKDDDPLINSSSMEQKIILNNERFTIPEILFCPSDIGIPQKGIAEAVVESVYKCPESYRHSLLANIVVCGGCAEFKNFKSRLFQEIRQRFDQKMFVHLSAPKKPSLYNWYGGQKMARSEIFFNYMTTKQDYYEFGHSFIRDLTKNFHIKD